jgi:two-component system nitrogen regulation response regulator GlnG
VSDHVPAEWAGRLETETRQPAASPRLLVTVRVPGLTVLAHPDPQRVGERVALPELAAGRDSLLSRLEPQFSPPGSSVRRPLADPHLSRRPLRLASAPDGGLRLLRGDSTTAVTVDGEPLEQEHALTAAAVQRGTVLLLGDRVALLLHPLDPAPPKGLPPHGLIGDSTALDALREEIERAAGLAGPVLLRGESGTGKELVARALHAAGPRRAGPFLAVNLGAVPASLAAAELFGASRGAYTGAERRDGYFVQAAGGTLFLDEIGETPVEIQPLLLRALESGEIQPVGGAAPRRIDVRWIAATDADLEAAVAAGRLRAPLLHRLSSYVIRLPPLRERRDDIGRLLLDFLRRELAVLGTEDRLDDPGPDREPWLPAALVARLAAHDWPGNVRELRNAARRIAVHGRDAVPAHLGAELEALLRPAPAALPAAGPPVERGSPRTASDIADDELLAALRASRWRLLPAAARLGISRTSLYKRIERSPHLRKAADLSADEIRACFHRCGGDLDAMAEALEVSRPGLERRARDLGLL